MSEMNRSLMLELFDRSGGAGHPIFSFSFNVLADSREDDLAVFVQGFRSLKRYPRYRSQNNYVRTKQVIFSLQRYFQRLTFHTLDPASFRIFR